LYWGCASLSILIWSDHSRAAGRDGPRTDLPPSCMGYGSSERRLLCSQGVRGVVEYYQRHGWGRIARQHADSTATTGSLMDWGRNSARCSLGRKSRYVYACVHAVREYVCVCVAYG